MRFKLRSLLYDAFAVVATFQSSKTAGERVNVRTVQKNEGGMALTDGNQRGRHPKRLGPAQMSIFCFCWEGHSAKSATSSLREIQLKGERQTTAGSGSAALEGQRFTCFRWLTRFLVAMDVQRRGILGITETGGERIAHSYPRAPRSAFTNHKRIRTDIQWTEDIFGSG
jgi:hypothetical protein